MLGRIGTILVEEGDTVRKDQVLIRMEDEDLESQARSWVGQHW